MRTKHKSPHSNRILLASVLVILVLAAVIFKKAAFEKPAQPTGLTNPSVQPSDWQVDTQQQTNPFQALQPSEQPPLTAGNTMTDEATSLQHLQQQLKQLTRRVSQLEQQLKQAPFHQTSLHQTDPVSLAATHTYRPMQAANLQLMTLDRLLNGGIDETRASEIIRRQNQTELQRLELQDKARRENYYMTERYREELAAIDANQPDLRSELGDDDYDRFLFNNRMNNRVKVLSVMLGSAAEEAGLQNNDIILEYDGKRIFSWDELKNATSAGVRNEYVSLNVLRNGELFSLSVPRGPLGIRLGAARVEP